MMWGSFIMPVALMIFAFTGAYYWVHWIGTLVVSLAYERSLMDYNSRLYCRIPLRIRHDFALRLCQLVHHRLIL